MSIVQTLDRRNDSEFVTDIRSSSPRQRVQPESTCKATPQKIQRLPPSRRGSCYNMHQWKVFFAASKWRRVTGTNMKRTNKRHAVARIFCARFLNRRQQREQRANDRKLCLRISLLPLRPPVQIARGFSVLVFLNRRQQR